MIINSINANQNKLNLSSQSCLLKLTTKPPTSYRIAGSEITKRWLEFDTSSITSLICKAPLTEDVCNWEFDVSLTSEFNKEMEKMRFHCTTSPEHESDKLSVAFGPNCNQYLDMYFLGVYPSLHLTNENEEPPFVSKLLPVSSLPISTDKVLLIGHRGMGAETVRPTSGCRQQWPENTILSLIKASQLGLPMVEFDVQPFQGSKDFIIYHNFRICMQTPDLDLGGSLGSKSELDLHQDVGKINGCTPCLISKMTLSEIDNLTGCPHSNDHLDTAIQIASSAEEELMNPIQLDRSSPIAQYFPLLIPTLRSVPHYLSMNIEIKYPVETPLSSYRVIHELGVSEGDLCGYGRPFEYFWSINKTADALLEILWRHGGRRAFVLSSFNPDLCLALRLKQSTFPVLFISRGGHEPPMDQNWSQTLDPRHHSAASAANWAHLIGADGVVLHASSFGTPTTEGLEMQTERSNERVRELVDQMARQCLACVVYGPEVSSQEYRSYAAFLGISAICIDDVEAYLSI